jgi:biotin---protein ligase
MNVLIHTSSPSLPLSNLLRSLLSPFYTVQPITSLALATQPWTASCALLVLPSPSLQPLSLPKPAHNAIQEYIASGGRMLGIGQGVSLLPHRPAQAQQQGRLDLWDAKAGTAIVPEAPCETSGSKSTHSSIIRLHTGALISGLWPATVPFELTYAISRVVIHGHWEVPIASVDATTTTVAATAAAVAGVEVPVGSGRAAFWGVSLGDEDGIDQDRDFVSSSALALLRYALTSLGLTLPATESSSSMSSGPLREIPAVPRYPLPQFLLHPHGKRHITETVFEKLGLSSTTTTNADSACADQLGVVAVLEDKADTFYFHRAASVSDGARLVAEARESTETSQQAPRVVIVLPPDELPPRELTPRFNVEKYFAVLAEVRGDKGVSPAVDGSWGLGEALFYGEAVTSTQTMLDK